MNLFLGDMSKDLAGLTGSLGDMKNQIPDIEGSITSALEFVNQVPNIFPFEMPPNPAVSDFYTLAKGPGAQPDSMTPSPAAIGEIANKAVDIKIPKKIPFAEPSKDQSMVDLVSDKVIDAAKESHNKFMEAGGQENLNGVHIEHPFIYNDILGC